jgi:hypothetical protein
MQSRETYRQQEEGIFSRNFQKLLVISDAFVVKGTLARDFGLLFFS